MEFTQLAYETAIDDMKYLNNLVEAEKKVLANKIDQKPWLTTLSTINDKSLGKYFTYTLPASFYADIKTAEIREWAKEEDTTYEISRDSVSHGSLESLLLGLGEQ